MIADVLLGLMSGAFGIAVACVAAVALRKYRAAQTTDTNASAGERRANTQKTEGEAWRAAMEDNTDLFGKVQELQGQLIAVTDLLGEALGWIAEAKRREDADPTAPLPPLPPRVAARAAA